MNHPSPRMPVVFIGHGNPMNALYDNAFTQMLAGLGQTMPRPQAILCISAHWMSEGTWITHMQNPKTIHDFYGFPQELFNVQYPASGNPALADEIVAAVPQPRINTDDEMWGFDHGAWTVLKHMYPKADIPLLQLSIYMAKSPQYHYELGQYLRQLRHRGVLIVGSGNIVHNLRRIDFADNAKPFDWAVEFDQWVKEKLEQRDDQAIIKNALDTPAGKLSIPTMDHWYPLLYTLGAADKKDTLKFTYEGIDNASISMRCLSFS